MFQKYDSHFHVFFIQKVHAPTLITLVRPSNKSISGKQCSACDPAKTFISHIQVLVIFYFATPTIKLKLGQQANKRWGVLIVLTTRTDHYDEPIGNTTLSRRSQIRVVIVLSTAPTPQNVRHRLSEIIYKIVCW
jgi:hypothetical protein